MATIPINNPQIPFLGRIPGGFRPSLMIRVKGKITERRGRCVIDFVASPSLNIGQDVIFHTSIRLDEGVLVRNAFINRKWGLEDRYGKFDFKYNKPFEIIFLAEQEFYKIAVNGVHIGVFRHRLPINLVNYIHVTGDVQIEHILLEQDMQSAQAANVISALTSSTSSVPTYVPFTPTPAPQIQISYQPPGQHQIHPIQSQMSHQVNFYQVPMPGQQMNTIQAQPPYNPQQPSLPYPMPSAPNGQNQPPPPYDPKWF